MPRSLTHVSRRLTAALALAALVLTAAALPRPAAAALSVGIGDQKPEMFTDPYFAQLHIRKARLVVPWDVFSQQSQRDELDTWMQAAEAAGVRPLLTFGHSRRTGRRRIAPTPAQLVGVLRRLRDRYPFAVEFATWNEPNLCGEPLCHKPELAARYYDALVTACPSCTILASEVLDTDNMVSWVRAFMRHVRHRPRIWGLHNYLDANRMRTSGTRRLLAATTGQVWFTETGGIVKRRTKHKAGGFVESVAHAGQAVRWVFDRLAPLSPRITRIYLYHWNPGGPLDSWDSALFDIHGRPRTAWRVLRNRLQELFAARARAAAKHARP